MYLSIIITQGYNYYGLQYQGSKNQVVTADMITTVKLIKVPKVKENTKQNYSATSQ